MKVAYISLVDISEPTGPGTNELESILALLKNTESKTDEIRFFVQSSKTKFKLPPNTFEVDFKLKKYLFGSWFLWQIQYLFILNKIVKKEFNPDLYVLRIDKQGLIISFVLSLILRSKRVALRHIQIQPNPKKGFIELCKKLAMNFALKRAFVVDTTQAQMKEMLVQEYKREIYTIKNAVNLDTFHLSERKKQFDINDKFIVGYIGGVPKKRGAELMIRSFNSLKSVFPHIELLIVGDSKYANTSDVEELKALAKDLNVSGFVEFTGFVPYDEVPFYMNKIDIGVALWPVEEANKYGNSSQKIYQYLATGSPIVIPKNCHQEIENTNFGIGINSSSENEFKNAIEVLYNRLQTKEISPYEIREFSANYSSDNRAKQQLEIWKKS